MNLEQLSEQLRDYDGKLDRSLRLNARLLRESRVQRTGSRLTRLSRSVALELAGNAVAVALLGMFIASHIGEPRFFVPAVVLDFCALGLILLGARQLAVLNGIDYGAPVVAIQKRLGTLKAMRVRTMQWILIASPLLWTPLLIVTARGLLGLDVYALGAGWLLWNLLFGVAVIVVAVWVSKRHSDRMRRSTLVQRLMNSLAGNDLAAAVSFLDELAELEKE
jgi:hypothetical protein